MPRTTHGSAERPAKTRILIGLVRCCHLWKLVYLLLRENLQSSHVTSGTYVYGGETETHNTAARRKAKDDSVGGEDNRCKVFRTAIYGFEVHFFTSGARKHGAKFEPDKEPTE
jgi:hypothetical protein